MKANQGKSVARNERTQSTPSSSLSAKALEYYRMYATNEELPKYFSGEYDLPQLEVAARGRGTTALSPAQPPAIPEIVVDEVCASPTSSVVSKEGRKQLEWDSGADIGYVNCEASLKQKSASMPILDEVIVSRHCKQHQHSLPPPLILSDDLQSSTSGERDGNFPPVGMQDAKTHHHQVMNFLRRKVGLPAAESTPQLQEIRKCGSDPAIYSQTPKIPSKSESKPNQQSGEPRVLNTASFNYEVTPTNAKVDMSDSSTFVSQKNDRNTTLPNKTRYFAKYRSAKLQNLQIAPPVSLECLSFVKTEDCQTQTTQNVIKDSINIHEEKRRHSIGIQTSRRLSKQEIIYLFHAGSQIKFDKSSSSGTATLQSNTMEDKIFSHCNSFEYVPGSADFEETAAVLEGHKSSTTQSVVSLPNDKPSGMSTLSQEEVASNVDKSTSLPSHDDLARSLKIMKKLVKSDKYDDAFKQKYLRKIAQKLISSPLCREGEFVESGTNSSSTRIVQSDSDKMLENNPNLQNDPKSSGVSWKDSLTLSEQLYSSLENKNDMSTDSTNECLVSFAKRERDNQLSWINGEIEHLAKLKALLESKKQRSTKSTVSVPTIDINNMADYKKSTSVYMITTEKHNGHACDKNCGTKTVQNSSGEIDFHVHNSLGVRDYKFKEIVTKITPRDDSAAIFSVPQAKSDCIECDKSASRVRSSKECVQKCNDDDSVSERRPGTPCRHPSGSCGEKSYQSGGNRRARDKLATLPTLHATESRSRSRTPSSKSTSITEETSAYMMRRRHHRPSMQCGRRASGKRRKSDVADKNMTPSKATAVAVVVETDTDSSHYESLPKYHNHSAGGNVSRSMESAQQKASANSTFFNRPELYTTEAHAYGGGSKKETYMNYKATKHKDAGDKATALRNAVASNVRPLAPVKDSRSRRRSNADKHQRSPTEAVRTWTSDAEPQSISDDDSKHYRMQRRRGGEPSSPTIVDASRTKKNVKRKPSVQQPQHQHLAMAGPSAHIGDIKEVTATRVRRSDMNDLKRATAAVDSKTDTDQHNSFERCTNTEGPWIDDDEYDDTVFFCNKQTADGVTIYGDDASCKPSKTGTVSLQTIHAPQFYEKKSVDSKDIQVNTDVPLMKQMCVGDDIKHSAKETASQIPHNAPGVGPKSGLSLTPAAVVTYMPHSDTGADNSDVRPFKMVKDMSKINLNSAVIISSIVTSSVSNPDDNIRRLVLEMPLNDPKDKDGKVCRLMKRCDKKKDVTNKDSSILMSCSCGLHSSSSHVTTTVGTTSDMMCSCCGKCVISSESSITIGENTMAAQPGAFCWPCYYNAANRTGEWPPQALPVPLMPGVNGTGVPPEPPNYYPPSMYVPPVPMVEDNALEKIRDTLRQLAEIDNEEEVAGCGGGSTAGASRKERLVCTACNKKIKHGGGSFRETSQQKKAAVAYVLKFEQTGDGRVADDDKSEPPSLQEICVKLPPGTKPKLACGSGGGGSGGRNRKRTSHKDDVAGGARNLQEYLSLNRPDFLESAESRRRFLVEMAYMRDQRCRRYKDLLDMPDGDQGSRLNPKSLQKPHLFTTKEMKRMTAKNYKKLPEVQEKQLNMKRERMKQTNKLLVSIFNKKLKETVLRGQASLSTSISVINM